MKTIKVRCFKTGVIFDALPKNSPEEAILTFTNGHLDPHLMHVLCVPTGQRFDLRISSQCYVIRSHLYLFIQKLLPNFELYDVPETFQPKSGVDKPNFDFARKCIDILRAGRTDEEIVAKIIEHSDDYWKLRLGTPKPAESPDFGPTVLVP